MRAIPNKKHKEKELRYWLLWIAVLVLLAWIISSPI